MLTKIRPNVVLFQMNFQRIHFEENFPIVKLNVDDFFGISRQLSAYQLLHMENIIEICRIVCQLLRKFPGISETE